MVLSDFGRFAMGHDKDIVTQSGRPVSDVSGIEQSIRRDMIYPGDVVRLLADDGSSVRISAPEGLPGLYEAWHKGPAEDGTPWFHGVCEVDVYADGAYAASEHYGAPDALESFAAAHEGMMVIGEHDYADLYVESHLKDALNKCHTEVDRIAEGCHGDFDPKAYKAFCAASSELMSAVADAGVWQSAEVSEELLRATRIRLECGQYYDNIDLDTYSDEFKDVRGYRPRGSMPGRYLSDAESAQRKGMLDSYEAAAQRSPIDVPSASAEVRGADFDICD